MNARRVRGPGPLVADAWPPGATVGDVLRRERVRQGKGLRETCREMGISSAHLSGIERGRLHAGEGLLYRLAERYGLDPWELLLRDGRIPEAVVLVCRTQPRWAAKALRRLLTPRGGP